MKQNQTFKIFGDGHWGLKAGDLDLYAPLIQEVGLHIPEGMVISTEIFDRLCDTDIFFDIDVPLPDFSEVRAFINTKQCPGFFRTINEEILSNMEMHRPYAIRSSSLSDRGGTGIFKSVFFWPTGDKEKDLRSLWKREKEVYASEFSRDAQLWRKRIGTPIGMAILIQPIIGQYIDQVFLPFISGLAYTSYKGVTTVRAVAGLGTRAVSGDGLLYYEAPEPFDFTKTVWNQGAADCLSLKNNGLDIIPTQTESFSCGFNHDEFLTFCGLFPVLEKLKQKGNFYLEWAVYDGKIYILQINPYEDKIPNYQNISFDTDRYFQLLEGNDLITGSYELYSGHVSCDSIVLVWGWNSKTAEILEDLNTHMKNYLLIIPQEALSLVSPIYGNPMLSFKHFSQASAVVEKQSKLTQLQKHTLLASGRPTVDHTNGTGAYHFAELCERADILFVGASFNIIPLTNLSDKRYYLNYDKIEIWNRRAEVIVNQYDNIGYVYVEKTPPTTNTYTYDQVKNYANFLGGIANSLNDDVLRNSFYAVYYAIIPEKGSSFNPFTIDADAINDFGGIAGIKESIKIVIDKLPLFINIHISDIMKAYLEDLLLHLA